MQTRREIKEKIYETVDQLKNPDISYARRRDLKKYLTRLNKELKQKEKWDKYGKANTPGAGAGNTC